MKRADAHQTLILLSQEGRRVDVSPFSDGKSEGWVTGGFGDRDESESKISLSTVFLKKSSIIAENG